MANNIGNELRYETHIIGTILNDSALLEDYDVRSHLFRSSVNQMIVNAMWRVKGQGKTIDPVTVTEAVMEQNEGAGSEAIPVIYECSALDNPDKFDEYLGALKTRWTELRKRTTLSKAQQEDWSVESTIKALEEIEDGNIVDFANISELVAENYNRPFEPSHEDLGIPTGYAELNNVIAGFTGNKLITIGARPGMAKTDLMLNLARHTSQNGARPIIFSLEMTKKELFDRLISQEMFTNRMMMRDPHQFMPKHIKEGRWNVATGKLAESGIIIADKPAMRVSQMRAIVRRVINRDIANGVNRTPIVFIDYLTIIGRDASRSNHDEITQVVEELKNTIAKEFDITVVVLAQLSRGVEQRVDKRPMLADLRESGSIEETSDQVWFLYRPAYYDPDQSDELEIIIAKHRGGQLATVELFYDRPSGSVVSGGGAS